MFVFAIVVLLGCMGVFGQKNRGYFNISSPNIIINFRLMSPLT